ncbi:hypothetical protein Tco_1017390 [Tanacetum coccineum]|uniref:Reverse transcriptase domain-containing protein n=1 Tax=Tanacetum coccineum TaxID=301880 RepID=A0ABQ5FSL2_9ASTR
MPKYAKFLKSLLTNKARLEEACKIIMNERCSAVLLNKLPSKEKDPGSFTIPCDIGQLHIDKADLGASISLMPYTMYKKLGLGEPKATRMSLELADRSDSENSIRHIDSINTPYPVTQGTSNGDNVKSEHLYSASANEIDEKKPELKNFPQHLEYAYLHGDKSFPIIISSELSEKKRKTHHVVQSIIERKGIDDLDETINNEAQELLTNEEPGSFLSRGLEKSIDQSDLECCESTSSDEKNGSDSENSIRRIDSVNTPANEIDEKKPELKNLPQHLEYAYLHGDKSFPIIISSELSETEKISLLHVLERRKGAIAWKMSDIKGISPSYCTYKILMEDDYKPDSSKYQSLQRIKKKLPSPVLMGLSLNDECRLDYVMLLPLFKDA